MEVAHITNAVTIGIVLVAWRALHSQIVSLATTVADIDRRLARVEGALSVKIPDRTSPKP